MIYIKVNMRISNIIFSALIILLLFDISYWLDSTLTGVKWTVFLITVIFISFFGYKKMKISITSLLVGVFFFVIILSTFLNNGINNESLTASAPYILLLFFYLSISLSSSDYYCKRFLFLSNKFICGVLIISIPLIWFSQYYEDSRFIGFFSNPNSMSGFACLCASFLISDVISGNNRKRLKIFLIASCFVIVLLTKSRASLGVFAGIVLYCSLFVDFGVKRRYKFFIIISACGLGLYSYLHSSYFFMSDFNSEKRELLNFNNRMPILEAQMQSFFHSPLLGSGLVINKDSEYGRYGGELSYTDILSYGGIIGFFIFLCVNIFTYLNLRRHKNRLNNISIVFVCILLLSIFEGYISNVGSLVTLIYWTIISTSAKAYNEKN